MIVFNLFQHHGEADGQGDHAGTFSSLHLAKYAAGGKEAGRVEWVKSHIDTQGEQPAWRWGAWEIHLVEVDVSCDGVRLVLKTDSVEVC